MGRALEVYSRQSDGEANDYTQFKEALKQYDLTEAGYRLKFIRSIPKAGESQEQFIFRLKEYLRKWMAFV